MPVALLGRGGLAAELAWQAPASCPDRESVEHRIRALIGIPFDQAIESRFKCAVTRSPSGAYRLELRVETPPATVAAPPRIIEAPTCDQVADTAAVAIALALGVAAPDAATNDSPDMGGVGAKLPEMDPAVAATAEAKTPTPAAAPVTSRAASRVTSPSSQLWLAGRLGGVIDLGSLPGISLGFRPVAELGVRAVSARLWSAIFSERRVTRGDGSGGEFSLWTVGVGFCGSTQRAGSRASLCAGTEVGKMKGSGFGALTVARQGSAWWVTPEVEVEVASAPWLFGMRTYVGAVAGVPLIRGPFVFGGNETVHRAGVIIGRLNVGLELDWQ